MLAPCNYCGNSPCVYCGKGTGQRCTPYPTRADIIACCAYVIRQTSPADLSPDVVAAALYDCLLAHAEQSLPVQQGRIKPQQLLYQGWEAFVAELF